MVHLLPVQYVAGGVQLGPPLLAGRHQRLQEGGVGGAGSARRRRRPACSWRGRRTTRGLCEGEQVMGVAGRTRIGTLTSQSWDGVPSQSAPITGDTHQGPSSLPSTAPGSAHSLPTPWREKKGSLRAPA